MYVWWSSLNTLWVSEQAEFWGEMWWKSNWTERKGMTAYSWIWMRISADINENSISRGSLKSQEQKEIYQAPKHILISRSFTGADDMYIAYDLFIIFPILRSTLYKPGTTHSCNMHFQYTLLADIFHSSSQFILQELAFLRNLFSLLQEVLGSRLHRRRQHVSLLGAALLLVRWAFVAGVHQSGDLWRGLKMNVQQRQMVRDLKCVWQMKALNSFLIAEVVYDTFFFATEHIWDCCRRGRQESRMRALITIYTCLEGKMQHVLYSS